MGRGSNGNQLGRKTQPLHRDRGKKALELRGMYGARTDEEIRGMQCSFSNEALGNGRARRVELGTGGCNMTREVDFRHWKL